jgi:hypothetical protein
VFWPGSLIGNDGFGPLTKDGALAEVVVMDVFNRWGNLVFHCEQVTVGSPSARWDGRFRGKDAASDVYVYRAEILLTDGKVLKKAGDVLLLR